MAVTCPWCRSADIGAGFDGFQCFSCGGHMKMDGSPTVPTSALTVDGTYGGPGAELVDDPNVSPPERAQDPVR